MITCILLLKVTPATISNLYPTFWVPKGIDDIMFQCNKDDANYVGMSFFLFSGFAPPCPISISLHCFQSAADSTNMSLVLLKVSSY